MIIRENEKLDKYTTIKIGGLANKFYIPESREELIQLIGQLQENYLLLAGGSNLLINDEKEFPNVIYLMNAYDEIIEKGEGRFYIGCSVRLQQLILIINEKGYGGIEYLFSVPGTVGGAILMNAGTGKEQNQCISDYIEYVEVLVSGKIKKLNKTECNFSYRNSLFKNTDMVILGAEFNFDYNTPESFQLKRKERLEKTRKRQDSKGYNFGSVFLNCNKYAMGLIKFWGLGKKNSVCFSKKTNNWLINMGCGSYAEAINVINRAKLINRIFGVKATLEVIIWK